MITVCARDSANARNLPFELVTLDKGLKIYNEGDPARHWYEIVSGIVRTCRFLADGHRQLTGFFYADEVFGVDRAFYREAAESVTAVVLRRYAVKSVNDNEDSTANSRDKVLEKALDSARRNIFMFGHRTAANRMAAFLIEVAERSGATPRVQLPMTRSDIADHLNLTLHTVSRTICELARKGLIALDGPQNVRILDLESLCALAGEASPSYDSYDHTLRVAWEAPEPCNID